MEFKHWLVVFLCFAGPFGGYYLYWLPRRQEAIDRRKNAFLIIKDHMIPVLIKVEAQTPLECFNTLKRFVSEFQFTEEELGYSLNDLARFALLCIEKQLTEVKQERDSVHQQLMDAKSNADSFPSLYQWAVHVECTHRRFQELCNRYDTLWSERCTIQGQIDSSAAEQADRDSLLFLMTGATPKP